MWFLKHYILKTISSVVSEYIKSKPFLSSALSDGIINLTSLSRIIKPDIEEVLRKNVNHGAIVMALNRLSVNLEFQHTHKIVRVIKNIGDIKQITEYLRSTTYSLDPQISKN